MVQAAALQKPVPTKEELLRDVRGFGLMGSTRTVHSRASRLRLDAPGPYDAVLAGQTPLARNEGVPGSNPGVGFPL
jgi:hypothetical protein